MDVKDAIRTRRAYRSLDPIEVTDELIMDLAESAQLAPSCMNKQPWQFILIYDPEKLKQLFTTLSPGNKWVEKVSLIIAVVSRIKADCVIGERIYYLFDTGMATAFILLRATELGLVAHPIAGYNEELAKEILKIPNDMQLITLVNIGKHSEKTNPELSEDMRLGEKQRPPRKKIKQFVFLNEYKKKLVKD